MLSALFKCLLSAASTFRSKVCSSSSYVLIHAYCVGHDDTLCQNVKKILRMKSFWTIPLAKLWQGRFKTKKRNNNQLGIRHASRLIILRYYNMKRGSYPKTTNPVHAKAVLWYSPPEPGPSANRPWCRWVRIRWHPDFRQLPLRCWLHPERRQSKLDPKNGTWILECFKSITIKLNYVECTLHHDCEVELTTGEFTLGHHDRVTNTTGSTGLLGHQQLLDHLAGNVPGFLWPTGLKVS